MQKLMRITTFVLSMLLIGCGAKEPASNKQDETKQVKAIRVTVTKALNTSVEITEQATGTLEGLIDPTIAAEVAARVVKVHVSPGQAVKQGQLIATLDATDFVLQRNEAHTEVSRIEALLENQSKTVLRNQALVDKKFISQNAVDTEVAQRNVLKEQLEGAKARVNTINNMSSKTQVYSPISGVVEKKIVDTGEFVKIGDPIVQIISKKKLRAHLPFPEHIGAQLKSGLKVLLTSPLNTQTVHTVIHDLKPMITEGSRSIDVIADIQDGADWQPGATVTGTVVLGVQNAALVVPEQSVVLRPAGEVVYIVRDNKAFQAIVNTRSRQNGMIEILSGVQANDIVVVDGSGFLTDNTPVNIANPKESTP